MKAQDLGAVQMKEKPNAVFWTGAKLIAFAVFLLALIGLFYYAISVVVISMIGIGIAVLLAPVLSFLRLKFKIPRILSALVCLFVLVLILGGAGYGLWYLVDDQFRSLSNRAPEISAALQTRLYSILARYPWLNNQIETLELGGTAKNLAFYLLKGLKLGFYAISGFLFALVLSLYAAVSLNEYFQDVIEAFPKKHREKATLILTRCAVTIRLWLRAQLLDMLIVGVLTAAGLFLVGVEYWAVYGILTAIFAIIPYVGTFMVVICAGLITLASEPSLVPWVIVVFVVVQQIEGDFILPMLMRGQVKLPEVPLLIFMLLFGVWLGLVGVLLAPALFAILRILYLELYLPWAEQD